MLKGILFNNKRNTRELRAQQRSVHKIYYYYKSELELEFSYNCHFSFASFAY